MHKKWFFSAASLVLVLMIAASSTLVAHAGGYGMPPAGTAARGVVNLAWFYKPPADGNLTLIAQNFNTYVLTKSNEAARNQLISLGASQPMLEYLRFEAIMDPGSCTITPWQNQVANLAGDFCTISAQHPDWFLLNSSGNRIIHMTGTTKFVLMDPGNPGWRAFFLARVSQILAADPAWAGVFLDNVEVTNAFHVDAGEVLAKYPDNASFSCAVMGFVQYLHDNYFHPNGKLLYANLVSRGDDSQFTSYMTNLDGAMHEGWAVDDTSRWRPADVWEKHMALVEQAQSQGKHLILVSHGVQSDLELQKFAFASYLLVSNGTSAFRYADGAAYNQAWLYDDYNILLGSPIGSRYKVGTAWKRDFAKGWVSVDPVSHAVVISTQPAATTTPTLTAIPTLIPTVIPTLAPTFTPVPTQVPTTLPTQSPTLVPTVSPTATVTKYDDKCGSIVYSAGWSKVAQAKSYSSGYSKTKILNSSAKLTFTGTRLTIVYYAQPSGGKMQVYVDGKYIYEINEKSSKIIYQATWDSSSVVSLSPGSHTLKLVFASPSGSTVTLDVIQVR